MILNRNHDGELIDLVRAITSQEGLCATPSNVVGRGTRVEVPGDRKESVGEQLLEGARHDDQHEPGAAA